MIGYSAYGIAQRRFEPKEKIEQKVDGSSVASAAARLAWAKRKQKEPPLPPIPFVDDDSEIPATIERLWPTKYSVKQIAIACRISRPTCYAKAAALGLGPHNKGPNKQQPQTRGTNE